MLHNVLTNPFPYEELRLPPKSRLLCIGPAGLHLQKDIQAQDGTMGINSTSLRDAVQYYLEYIRDMPDVDGINLIQIHITKPLHHKRWSLIKDDSYALPMVCKRNNSCHYETRQLYEFCNATNADAAKVTLPIERVEKTFYSITDGERTVVIPAGVKNHSAINAYRIIYAAFFGEK